MIAGLDVFQAVVGLPTTAWKTIVPETCWAVSTRQSNKYKIDCASGWLFYEYLKMHETTNPGFSLILVFEYFSKICRENSSLVKIGHE
jgi:hypothetical protein